MNKLYLIDISHANNYPTEASFSRNDGCGPRAYSPLTWSSCKRLMEAIYNIKCRKEIYIGAYGLSIMVHPRVGI